MLAIVLDGDRSRFIFAFTVLVIIPSLRTSTNNGFTSASERKNPFKAFSLMGFTTYSRSRKLSVFKAK